MHTHTDDLYDVIIPEGTRTSDDPSQWVIPEALVRHWGNTPDATAVHRWWDQLSATDERLHGKFTAQQMADMAELVQSFDKALVNTRFTIEGRTELREHFVGLFAYGLTFTQAANACNISLDKALSVVLRGQWKTSGTVEVRLEAERLLREGVPRNQVATRTGLSNGQVTSWAEALQIPLTSVASLGYPKEMRQFVFDMADQGFPMSEIRKMLEQEWPEYPVKRVTASAWLSRRKRGVYGPVTQAVAS